jgi:hypothetical protein
MNTIKGLAICAGNLALLLASVVIHLTIAAVWIMLCVGGIMFVFGYWSRP